MNREQIDFSKLTSTDSIIGEDADETIELNSLLCEATNYLSSFSWCKRIKESFFGFGVGRVVGVFLFNIERSSKNADEWLWVVVGDIPPAYLVTDLAPNPTAALDAYIDEMSKWVKAVKAKESVSNLILVNVPPSLEYAEMLRKRLCFLEQEIIPNFK